MRCNKCEQDKPESEFYPSYKTRCKACYKADAKAYRESIESKDSRECGKCKQTLDKSEFYKGCTRCKKCQCEVTNSNRARRAQRIKEGNPAKCSQCKQVKPAESFGQGKNTYCLECLSVRNAARNYGISIGEAEKLRAVTCCAICNKDLATTKDRHIDHCHDTGTVRGILCHSCNTGLGHFRDDPELMMAAIRYVTNSMFNN
jgi:hypothetical protein